MHRSILEEIAQQRLGDPSWRYVDAASIEVRVIKPRWRWMIRVCAEIPEGKCVLFPVPEGEDFARFASALRLSIAMSSKMLSNRYSIRRTKCLLYVAVLKAETWAAYYRRLENVAPPQTVN